LEKSVKSYWSSILSPVAAVWGSNWSLDTRC
jgi:hypothetical protein